MTAPKTAAPWALALVLLPTLALAADRGCAPKPVVTVAIAPLELADPPEKPERLYPAAAKENAVSGHVTLECNAVNGALADCAIDDETPSGQGFGASALKLAKTLIVRTAAVAQIVKVYISYDVRPPIGRGCAAKS